MSNRREELQAQYEDALFALLMDDHAEEEGKRLLEENERLKNDPSAAVPEQARRRCLKTIRRELARRDRRAAGRAASRVLKKAVVVVAVCVLLLTTAFAGFPEFRANALNLFIKVSERYTILRIDETPRPSEFSPSAEGSRFLFDYRLPAVPEGFTVDGGENGNYIAWIRYANDDGATIIFSVTKTNGGEHMIDTEDAQVDCIRIHGYDGMVVEKYYKFPEDDVVIHSVVVVWADTQQSTFVTVETTELEREIALELAHGVELVTAS